MSHRVHVLISGRVQGVGFRYATYSEAVTLQLRGWVRNLYDGRVEAEFESDDKVVLDQMIAWCHQGPRWARVDAVQLEWAEGDSCYQGFVIRG